MMSAPKFVAAVEVPPEWSSARAGREPQAKLPLEIDGEIDSRSWRGRMPDAPGFNFVSAF